MRLTSKPNSGTVHNRSGRTAALLSLVLAVFVFAATIPATQVAATTSKPAAQATTVAQATSVAPPPAGTSQVPDAVATGPAAPAPAATGPAAPAPVTTGQPAPSTGNPGSSTDVGPGANPATAPASTNSFPWLLVILVAVVLVLLVVAFVLLRGRRSAVATTASTVAVVPPPTIPTTATTTTIASAPPAATTVASTTATSTEPPAAVAEPATVAITETEATTATAPAVAPAPPAGTPLPTTLTCPNCATVNEWNENFCHECGQDLRPLRASIIAAAAPPQDIVTDDMPYLETLDRTDEQLEYVLSRKKVVIGTAAGNDIVIDAAFKGHETVSPRHAELRREGDGAGFMLIDLNSDNGTYVNDVRTGENLLAEGDQIRFGSVRFIYRVPSTG